jgi:hypothetical protein
MFERQAMDRTQERGEGKIGCILSLLVLIGGIAFGIKVLPVLYSNYTLAEFAGDLAGRAGIFKPDGLERDLREKAHDLEIPEALARGAMTIVVTGSPTDGTGVCTIRLDYTRTIDLYGIYKFDVRTNDTIRKNVMDVR